MITQPSITCPRCRRTSYNEHDIAQGYCGGCHWWTSDPKLGAPDVIREAEDLGIISVVSPLRTHDEVLAEFALTRDDLGRGIEVGFWIGLVVGLAIAGIAALLYAAGL